MAFTSVDTSPSGDSLAAAWAKVNSGFADTINEIVMGASQGWAENLTYGSGRLSQVLYTHGAGASQLQIKAAMVYSGSQLTAVTYQISNDQGNTWTSKGTQNFTYDGSGNLTQVSWS